VIVAVLHFSVLFGEASEGNADTLPCSRTGATRPSDLPPAVRAIRDAYLAERREEGWPVDDRLIESVARFAQETMYPLEWGSYATSGFTLRLAPDREAAAVLLVSLCFYTGEADSHRVERVRRGAADIVKEMSASITLPVMRRFADQLDETSPLFRTLHEGIEAAENARREEDRPQYSWVRSIEIYNFVEGFRSGQSVWGPAPCAAAPSLGSRGAG
jgi:hypothetical protein